MKQVVWAATAVLVACVSVQAVDIVSGVVDPYLRIQTALAADSVKGIPEEAAAIAAAAGKLGEPGSALHGAATELQKAADLTAARAAFGKLSDALLAYASSTKSSMGQDTK